MEKTEGEGGAGASPRGQKPTGIKKLSTAIAAAVAFAETICHPDNVHTGDVKEHEIDRVGGERAWVANGVAELVGKTQGGESCFREEVAVPLLEDGEVSRRSTVTNATYFNTMEEVA